MEEIHRNNIIHRNLAAKNILVFSFDKQNPDHIRVKVAGFDMSTIMEQNQINDSGKVCDSISDLLNPWRAPETSTGNNWSEKSDVFSFGFLIWECLCGVLAPLKSDASSDDILLRKSRRALLSSIHKFWPEVLDFLMNYCLSIDSESDIESDSESDSLSRPTFSQIKEKLVTFDGTSTSASEFIRQEIYEVTGIYVGNRELQRDGEIFVDKMTLKDHNIVSGDEIYYFPFFKGYIGIFGNHSDTPGIEILMSDSKKDCTVKELYTDNKIYLQSIVKETKTKYFNNNNKESQVYFSDKESYLNSSQCQQLRRLVDSKADIIDSDYKLPLTVNDLNAIIGLETTTQLLKLMDNEFDVIILRRCLPQGLCINFHLDSSFRTLQIALNNQDEYEGGRLVYALSNGSLYCPKCLAGSVTIHDNSIVHGVTKHTDGIRYGLFLIKTSILV